jgi:hypothetical protein
LAVIQPLEEGIIKEKTNNIINKILQEFTDVFRKELPLILPPNCGLEHKINMGDA